MTRLDMRQSEQRWQAAGFGSLLVACVGLASACSGQFSDQLGMGGSSGGSTTGAGGSGAGTSGAGVGGSSGGAGSGVGTGAGGTTGTGNPDNNITKQACQTNTPLGQRVVRLDFNQVATTITSLLGATAFTGVQLPGNIGDPKQRNFQALAVEGDFFTTEIETFTVNMIEGALGNAASTTAVSALTACAAPITDACALNWLTKTFAPKAYRRPLTTDEVTAINTLYTTTLRSTNGSASDEATKFAIEGIMLSPPSLYRTEFGTASGSTAKLTPYELASELSYFLTNAPPDATLTTAASSGKLATADGVASEVDRLLAAPGTIENVNQAVESYYELGHVNTSYTVKDPGLFPEWTPALAASMYGESDKFLRTTLWQGKLGDLLTSTTSFVDSTMAAHYGIAYPGAAGGTAFVQVQLPADQRSGILTQASIMTLKSRSNTTSVVARGLYVLGNVLCLPPPPPPPSAAQDPVTAAKIAAQAADTTATERDKAGFRDTTMPCMNCHLNFDQYGLAFENYDALGRWRTSYTATEAIDATVDLPPLAGGNHVTNGIGLEQVVAGNGIFTRCMATNFMRYARAEAQSTLNSTDCDAKAVQDNFEAASNQSFGGLVRSIAISQDLAVRGVQ
jgi:hypothetical protein